MHRIATIAALAALALTSGALQAAPINYSFDTTHSRITFYVNHFGYSNSVGQFHIGEGTFSFDADDWAHSRVDARIPVQSLELGLPKWNVHILSDEFLDAAKFPEIRFVSAAIEKTDATHGRVHGELTIHGVTKPVVLELRLNRVGEHPARKTPAAGFTATTTLKRSDFGVITHLPNVGDEIEIRIEVEAYVPKD